MHTLQPGEACDNVAAAAGLGAGAFLALNPLLDCSLLRPGGRVCLAAAGGGCAVAHTVSAGDHCSGLAEAAGVSLRQLLDLNPGLDEECTNLELGQTVCLSPAPNCTDTYVAAPGDSCASISAAAGLLQQRLLELNPGLAAACAGPAAGGLEAGRVWCVGPPGSSASDAAGVAGSAGQRFPDPPLVLDEEEVSALGPAAAEQEAVCGQGTACAGARASIGSTPVDRWAWKACVLAGAAGWRRCGTPEARCKQTLGTPCLGGCPVRARAMPLPHRARLLAAPCLLGTHPLHLACSWAEWSCMQPTGRTGAALTLAVPAGASPTPPCEPFGH